VIVSEQNQKKVSEEGIDKGKKELLMKQMTLTKKGRIQIPKLIRDRIGVKPLEIVYYWFTDELNTDDWVLVVSKTKPQRNDISNAKISTDFNISISKNQRIKRGINSGKMTVAALVDKIDEQKIIIKIAGLKGGYGSASKPFRTIVHSDDLRNAISLLMDNTVDDNTRDVMGKKSASIIDNCDVNEVKQLYLEKNIFIYMYKDINGNNKPCVITTNTTRNKNECYNIIKNIVQAGGYNSDLYKVLQSLVETEGTRRKIRICWYEITNAKRIDEILYRFLNPWDYMVGIQYGRYHNTNTELNQIIRKIPWYNQKNGKKNGNLGTRLRIKIRNKEFYLNQVISVSSSKDLGLNPFEIYRFFHRAKAIMEIVYKDHLADLKPLKIFSLEDIGKKLDERKELLLGEFDRDRLKTAWDNFGEVVTEREKFLNNELMEFGYRLMGPSYRTKQAWLEKERKNLPKSNVMTCKALARNLRLELLPGTVKNKILWNLTAFVGDNDELLGKLLACLCTGERAPGQRGKGLGVEEGFNEFLAEIAKNAVSRIKDRIKFSITAKTSSVSIKEAIKVLKGFSLDGKNAKTTRTSTDFSSSSGRSEGKITSQIKKRDSMLNINTHPKHTVAQLVTLAVGVASYKHGSMVGINLKKDSYSFKIGLVIGVISKKSKDNVASSFTHETLKELISNRKYRKYKLKDLGILTPGTIDLSKKLEGLPDKILKELYDDIMDILT
jgi:bifunctional DNA-binding transcriptional regulator/antitoxin component of YhaV-PrlF toxin-antitoxin module